jgi:hypothetical protein
MTIKEVKPLMQGTQDPNNSVKTRFILSRASLEESRRDLESSAPSDSCHAAGYEYPDVIADWSDDDLRRRVTALVAAKT